MPHTCRRFGPQPCGDFSDDENAQMTHFGSGLFYDQDEQQMRLGENKRTHQEQGRLDDDLVSLFRKRADMKEQIFLCLNPIV